MSKTWYGHYIDTIKGNDYVLFKDYLELDKTIEEKDKEIERLNNIINETLDDISFCLHSITQEKISSRDERTRQEMKTCEQILRERLDKLKKLKEGK